MNPRLHQSVYVGGCAGKISRVTSLRVEVRGTYAYYMGGKRGEISEPWVFQYDINAFTKLRWCPVGNQWDLSNVKALQESYV